MGFDRSKFDVSTYKKYMECVSSQIAEKSICLRRELCESMNHECTGIDISTCDPNGKILTISST